MSKSPIFSQKTLQKYIKDEYPKKESELQERSVKVWVFDMTWFFENEEDFTDFAKLINRRKLLKGDVYMSKLVDLLVKQYWDKCQTSIIR